MARRLHNNMCNILKQNRIGVYDYYVYSDLELKMLLQFLHNSRVTFIFKNEFTLHKYRYMFKEHSINEFPIAISVYKGITMSKSDSGHTDNSVYTDPYFTYNIL